MQNEEKRKRIIAAFTVTSVILIVILFAVVVYQIVEIYVLSSRKAELSAKYEETISQITEGNEWLENYELYKDSILFQLALQNGYRPQ